MIKLFKYEGYKLNISEEALLLKPFKEIWQRDKSKNKDKALQELGYIYFMSDPRSDYQYLVDEEERSKAIKEGEKVVIGVGFYFKRKGIDDFFKVAESMKDVKFIWFGYLNKFLTTSYILKCIKNTKTRS